MQPRTVGKIVIGTLTFVFVILSLYYISAHKDQISRAIGYAVLSLTFATFYRYLED